MREGWRGGGGVRFTHGHTVYGAERGTKKGPASSDARLGGPLADLLSPEIPSPPPSMESRVTRDSNSM